MNVAGYLLANRVGELLAIPRVLDEQLARELQADGWAVYRVLAD